MAVLPLTQKITPTRLSIVGKKIKFMKAIVCEKYGPPSDLVLKELPALTPGEKEVVIQVKACSLNFPDTLIIQGKYQYKPALPFTPGSDIAGVVSAVGSKVKHRHGKPDRDRRIRGSGRSRATGSGGRELGAGRKT